MSFSNYFIVFFMGIAGGIYIDRKVVLRMFKKKEKEMATIDDALEFLRGRGYTATLRERMK